MRRRERDKERVESGRERVPRDDGTDGTETEASEPVDDDDGSEGGKGIVRGGAWRRRGGARRPRDVRTNDDAREPAGPEHATRVPGVVCATRELPRRASVFLFLPSPFWRLVSTMRIGCVKRKFPLSFRDTSRR